MTIVLLLVIVAILLFGSSAFLGAVGMVLGSVAAVAALGYASYLMDLEPAVVLLILFGAACVLRFILFLKNPDL